MGFFDTLLDLSPGSPTLFMGGGRPSSSTSSNGGARPAPAPTYGLSGYGSNPQGQGFGAFGTLNNNGGGGGASGPGVTYGTTTSTGGSGVFQGAQNAIGGFLGVNPTYNTIHGDYYDPLEGGGQQMRGSIYSLLSGLSPTLNQNSTNTANALGQAYSLPGWAQARDLATSEMAGKYLGGSPQLDAAMSAMRAASGAASANTNAGIRSNFAQNGMSFGTGNQEAQSANSAANNASANNAEAQARMQNYQAERQIQNNAVNTYGTATTTPLSYLAQQNEAYTQPLTEISQMIKGLSGGGTVAQPDTTVDKGLMSNLFGAIGSI